MAIIRQVSSKTAEGLSTEIAKAYEDGLGINDQGVEVQIGGVSETVELGISWPHGRTAINQVFDFDISDIVANAAYTGVAATNSKKSYNIPAYTGATGSTRTILEVSLNGVLQSTSIFFGGRSGNEIALFTRNILEGNSYGQTVREVSVSASVLTLELFYSVGDLDLSITAKRVDNSNRVLSTVNLTPTPTVITTHTAATPARTFRVSSSSSPHSAVSGALFPSRGVDTLNISGGITGLTADQLRAELVKLYNSINGITATASGNTLTITLARQYAVGSILLTTVLSNSSGTEVYSKAVEGTITTDHRFATAEAHGTLYFDIKRPKIGETPEVTFRVPVIIPDNQSVTQLEYDIKNAILNFDTGDGKTLGSFLSVYTTTLATSGTTPVFENFKLVIDWGLSGRISGSIPAASDFIDGSHLIGSDNIVSTYSGTIDINDAVVGTTYTILSIGDATQGNFRTLAGVSTGSFGIGDRITPVVAGGTLSDLTTTLNAFVGGDRNVTEWDSFSTSSVLQPGGDTTHFATLIKV